MSDLWVFGYGSLMWRPDFPFLERRPARIDGYHRAFCIKSTHYRGTARRPGLVLGLDRGRSCVGIAYRIAPGEAAGVIAYLRARELIYGVYRERWLSLMLLGGAAPEPARALTYIAEPLHPAYAGRLALATEARIIRAAAGVSGANLDYVINTISHLRALGIHEPRLERLLTLTGPVMARQDDQALARPGVAGLRRIAAREPSVLAPVVPIDQRRFMHRVRLGAAQG